MNVQVWRIEDAQKQGPYTSEKSSSYAWQDSAGKHSDQYHPSPMTDVPEYNMITSFYLKKDILCGFNSYSQLRQWFSLKEIDNLKKLGFTISKYTVSTEYVWHGKYQSVFNYDKVQGVEYAADQVEKERLRP